MLSAEQLAEKLEKSEAGRKKLRHAISILQEKLDATDKVLKINETLRQECERERQRAEEEKKKADEEKRLRCILDKDSATFKEQLVKVLQRLSVVENRQKSDKKEVDRLRVEVKVAVEGVRAAAQAVDAVQSSFQSLEASLSEKVKVAVQGVYADSKVVNSVESSLQVLENSVTKKEKTTQLKIEHQLSVLKGLLKKERKSHVKLEHQLSLLKGLSKISRSNELPSSNIGNPISEEMVPFEMREMDVCRKKRLKHNGDFANVKSRNRKRCPQEIEVKNHVSEKSSEREKQTRKHKSAKSSVGPEDRLASERPDSFSQKRFKSPSFHILSQNQVEDQAREDRYHPEGINDHWPLQADQNHKLMPAESDEKFPFGKESLELALNDGGNNVSIHGSDAVIEEHEQVFDFVSSESDLDDDWWSGEKTLLSPTLPELHPLIYAPPSHVQPSSSNVCALLTPKTTLGQNHVAFQSDTAILDKDSRCPILEVDDRHYTAAKNDFQDHEAHLDKRADGPDVELIAMNERVLFAGTYKIAEYEHEHFKDKDRSSKDKDITCTGQVRSNYEEDVPIQSTCKTMTCERDAYMAEQENITDCLFEAITVSHPYLVAKSTSNSSERREDIAQGYNGGSSLEAVDNFTVKELSTFLDEFPAITSTSGKAAMEVDIASVPGVSCNIQMLDGDELRSRESNDPRSISSTSMNHILTNGFVDALSKDVLDVGLNREIEVSASLHEPDIVVGNLSFQPFKEGQSAPRLSSIQVTLLQGFDFLNGEDKSKLMMAGIIAMILKSYTSCIGSNKERLEVQGALIAFAAGSNLPIEWIACSLVSSITSMVKTENEGECSSPKVNLLSDLLQTFMDLIKNVFSVQVSEILDAIFAQLGRFLNEGKIIEMTFQGMEIPSQDVLISPGDIGCEKLLSYNHSTATLEDIHAGSKVLAGLCQLLACVSHLQAVVYEVLGWCDKDVSWLLTIFSSFASICGHTLFTLGPDDLLGHAICAIITELLTSVEQGHTKTVETISQSVQSSGDVSLFSQLPQGWEALKDSLEVVGMFNLETVLLSVLVSLQHIFTSGSHLFFINNLLLDEEYSDEGSNPNEWAPATKHETEHRKEVAVANDLKVKGLAVEQRLGQTSRDDFLSTYQLVKEIPRIHEKGQDCILLAQEMGSFKCSNWESWKSKYGEVVRALELIALHMGWEWTYNDLIIGHLWRMVVFGSAPISVACISHVLNILGRLGVDKEGMELPGVEELRRSLVHILCTRVTRTATSDSLSFSFLSQASAANSLLNLAKERYFKRKVSDRSDEIVSHAADPSAQKNSISSYVYRDFLKEWLHDVGIERQRVLPNSFKEGLALFSDVLPP